VREDQQGKQKHKVFHYRKRKKESKYSSKKFILKKTLVFSIHLKQEEKLTVRCGRDGGIEALEVHGMIMLRVKSEDYGRVIVVINNKESRNIQLQVGKFIFLRN